VHVYALWDEKIASLYKPDCIWGSPPSPLSLPRHNTENSKQIFPKNELRDLSANFHIHVSVSDLYIPKIGLPILLQEKSGPILGIYKSLTET
jgi:hypothetical protein